MPSERTEAVMVEGEAIPVNSYTRAVLGLPSLVTLKEDTEGDTMKVKIIRACNEWVEGDRPEVNADYGKQLIENGLAEEVTTSTTKKASAKS